MNIAKSKCSLCIAAAICTCIAVVQLLFLFLNAYPDAFRDAMTNQEFSSIRSVPAKKYQYSKRGKVHMKQASVTIVGVGKNVEHHLVSSLIAEIDQLCDQFKETHVHFVLEKQVPPDSEGALKNLQRWADDTRFNRTLNILNTMDAVEYYEHFNGTAMPREGRIATARNAALEAYRKGARTDYLINIDLDIVGWNIGGIQDTFGQNNRWDVACANGIILYGLYRDTYALRAPGIDTNHHRSGSDHALYNISSKQRWINRKNLAVSCHPQCLYIFSL